MLSDSYYWCVLIVCLVVHVNYETPLCVLVSKSQLLGSNMMGLAGRLQESSLTSILKADDTMECFISDSRARDQLLVSSPIIFVINYKVTWQF